MQGFAAVPYLDVSHLGDRTVNLMPLWDGEWFPVGKQLIEVKIRSLHTVCPSDVATNELA